MINDQLLIFCVNRLVVAIFTWMSIIFIWNILL